MNWQQFWDSLAALQDPHAQVGRTGGQGSIDQATLACIADYIVATLDIGPGDTVLDLCCGNGLLTRELARSCAQMIGVDLSPAQIAIARQRHSAANIRYVVGDVTRLQDLGLPPADKINLYFSFQYLERPAHGGAALAGMASLLRPGGRMLLGDVPERSRLAVFYPSARQRLGYHLRLALGRSPMGRFWSEAEMQTIAGQQGLAVTKLMQPGDLPYAHYRCDYLLWLPGNTRV
ncbi:MAG: hypothetical protein OHK0039_45960 [Bacteroidia bacterium]